MKRAVYILVTLGVALFLSGGPTFAQCLLEGHWIDGYGFLWSLEQTNDGEVTGGVDVGKPCPSPVWDVYGNTDSSSFVIGAYNPTGGNFDCVPYFVYQGSFDASCNSASGRWYNDFASGFFTMRRLAAGGLTDAEKALNERANNDGLPTSSRPN